MEKITSLFALFRQGQAVADPKAWKERQITATILGGVILALVNVAAAFGYALPIDPATANAIGGGVLAVVNLVLTLATSDKVGLPPKPEAGSQAVQ